ncbi:MAG: hypothetical protein ACRYF4_04070 [Janthinobacterium lividum]
MLTPRSFLPVAGAAALLLCGALLAQTADRSAAPPAPATTAPVAHSGTYSVVNGELIVAPGLRIPNGNVPWILDVIDGKQVLVPVHHAAFTQTTGGSATLQGAASRTAVHSSSPVFFVHTSDRTENTGDAGRGMPTGWALLQATVTDNARTVDRMKFSDVSAGTVCTGSALCAQAESLPDGWLRITPRAPLEAGEYALVPVPRSATSQSALAYDFTVNTGLAAPKDLVSPGQNLDAVKKKKR